MLGVKEATMLLTTAHTPSHACPSRHLRVDLLLTAARPHRTPKGLLQSFVGPAVRLQLIMGFSLRAVAVRILEPRGPASGAPTMTLYCDPGVDQLLQRVLVAAPYVPTCTAVPLSRGILPTSSMQGTCGCSSFERWE